ncbi:hypothetical protein NQ315_013321, partial [Exocentrus adspersus]
MALIYRSVHNQLSANKNKVAQKTNKDLSQPQDKFNLGDTVYEKSFASDRHKTKRRFNGPYKITKINPDNTCEITSSPVFTLCINLSFDFKKEQGATNLRKNLSNFNPKVRFKNGGVMASGLDKTLSLNHNLCESRWSAKYKSIRKFNEHFLDLHKALINLSTGNNTKFLQRNQEYSFLLEPTVNIVQAVSINIFDVRKHIQDLIDIFKNHRLNHSEIFSDIFLYVKATCDTLGLDIKMPRICSRQIHRSNIETETPEIYFRRNIFCPYLDSLIESIEERFSQKNSTAYMLFKLHPKYIRTLTSENLVQIGALYGLKNIKEEGSLWKDYIIQKNIDQNISYEELLEL